MAQVVNPTTLRSKGIVVLLGWTSARMRSILKYANIYKELGVPSVCAAPSIPEVWFSSYGSTKAKKLLKSAAENSKEGSGVLLHLFSGASTTFLPTFIKDLTSEDGKHYLSGVIIDSGPVIFGISRGLAVAKLMRQQGVFGGPLAYYASCTTGIMVSGVVGRTRRKSMRDMFDHLAMLQIPQLYLYSSSDSVALMEDIEDEMRLQISRGVDVSSHCWHGSEHVRHFLEYPEEYASQINQFMHKLRFVV